MRGIFRTSQIKTCPRYQKATVDLVQHKLGSVDSISKYSHTSAARRKTNIGKFRRFPAQDSSATASLTQPTSLQLVTRKGMIRNEHELEEEMWRNAVRTKRSHESKGSGGKYVTILYVQCCFKEIGTSIAVQAITVVMRFSAF